MSTAVLACFCTLKKEVAGSTHIDKQIWIYTMKGLSYFYWTTFNYRRHFCQQKRRKAIKGELSNWKMCFEIFLNNLKDNLIAAKLETEPSSIAQLLVNFHVNRKFFKFLKKYIKLNPASENKLLGKLLSKGWNKKKERLCKRLKNCRRMHFLKHLFLPQFHVFLICWNCQQEIDVWKFFCLFKPPIRQQFNLYFEYLFKVWFQVILLQLKTNLVFFLSGILQWC